MKKNSIGIVGMILGIVGLVTSCVGAGGLFGLVGVILSIIGLTRKDSKKGSAIAGLITGGLSFVTGIIAAVVIILSLTGAAGVSGQLIKYNAASAIASDSQLCDSIRTAMLTAAMDPEVVMSDDYYDKEIYKMLSTPNEEFRLDSLDAGFTNSKWGKVVYEILGIDIFQDAKTFRKNFKSSPAKDEGVVYIKVDSEGNSFTVYVNDDVHSGR